MAALPPSDGLQLLRLGAMPLPMDVGAFPVYLWERYQGTPKNVRHGDQSAALWLSRLGTLTKIRFVFLGRLAEPKPGPLPIAHSFSGAPLDRSASAADSSSCDGMADGA